MDKPAVILSAVKNIFYIDFIILDLIKDKIPFFDKHPVVFIWCDIQFFKKRETLWQFTEGAQRRVV